MFPKKIHFTCKDQDMFDNNACFRECFNKYTEMYKDYTIKIYFDNDIYQIIQEHFSDDYDFIKNVNGVVLADTFRYLILYLEGGIYSDLDCDPIIHIEQLYNNVHFHGDINNNYYIYPTNKKLINNKWDFYKNECTHCKFINNTDIDVDIERYECFGHTYVSDDTNIIIGQENFKIDTDNPYNNSRLCQWFIVAAPKQDVFLNCYKECIINLKKKYVHFKELKESNKMDYFYEVLNNTGPLLFTKIINSCLPNNSVCILPVDFFCCGSGSNDEHFQQLSKNSYIKHLFNSSWL